MFPVRSYEKLSQTTSRAYVECPPINLLPQASVASVHDTHFAINILPHSLPPKHHAGELVNVFAGEQARSCYSCGRTDRCGCGGNEDSFDSNNSDIPLENVEDLEIFDDSPNLQEDEQVPDIDGQDQEVEQEPHHDGQDQQEPTEYDDEEDFNNTEYDQDSAQDQTHDYNTEQEHQTAEEISQSWNCDTDCDTTNSYYEPDNSY